MRKALSEMKLDDLRARLRKGVASKKAKRPKAKPPTVKRLRCSKCRRPREVAKLTDPDVAEIVRDNPHPHGEPIGAYRCRACRIVWLIDPIVPPPEHTNCRSSI